MLAIISIMATMEKNLSNICYDYFEKKSKRLLNTKQNNNNLMQKFNIFHINYMGETSRNLQRRIYEHKRERL